MNQIKMGIMLVASLVAGLFTANGAVYFTGASGADNNFSTTANWNSAPTGGATFYIGTTGTGESTPAVVDSALDITWGNAYILSSSAYGTGTSYAEVGNEGTLRVNGTLAIGSSGNQYYKGVLTLDAGGTIVNTSADDGAFNIGGTAAGTYGLMNVEAGASLTQAMLTLNTTGVLNFDFGMDSVTTLTTTRTTAGGANTLNGLIQIDLSALNTAGSYTLIDSSSDSLLLAGTLKTILDGGDISGTGDYSSTNFEVLNGGSTQWALTTANGGQDLVLNVTAVPEPATIGLFGLSGLLVMILRRVRR